MRIFFSIFLVFSVSFLNSCSHFSPENEKIVQFPFAQELLERVQANPSRLPASIDEIKFNEKSPRRIYFGAYYKQYLTLARFLSHENEIHFCPQFHHDKIQTDSSNLTKVSFYRRTDDEELKKEYFPELVFNQAFTIQDHLNSMKKELITLCEDGVSDNFYKFDNLINHYANKISFHKNPESMRSVLKIPVFSNYYLIRMLEAPDLNLASNDEKGVIQLSKAHWFEEYISHATKQRKSLISNKMVKR